jgi:dTMP kinase
MAIVQQVDVRSSKFVVFEGINGCGKTTLLSSVVAELSRDERKVVQTREPGGTEIGKTLRGLVLNPPTPLAPLTELFLFAADRSEHAAKVIKPGIDSGALVVSDRYYYSTVAFQGYGRGLNVDEIVRINRIAVDGVFPDLVILVDLDEHEAAKRLAARQGLETDKFESESLTFQAKVRRGFLQMAETLPERFVILNGAETREALLTSAMRALKLPKTY